MTFIILIIIVVVLFFLYRKKKAEFTTKNDTKISVHQDDINKIIEGDHNLSVKNSDIVYILLRQKYNITGKLNDSDFKNLTN